MILDPIDQRIRDQGFNFVPFNRFLASPFQAPTGEEAEGNVAPGIPAIYQAKSGGRDDGGSYAASLGLGPDTRGFITSDFTNFKPNYSYTPPAYDDFPPQQNMFQKALGKGFDLAKTVGSGIVSAATGIPFAGPILEKGLGAIASQFEDRPLGAAVIDEFGNVYSEDELNASNALGGYYSDPARSARRRTARIQNMLERQRLGKKYSLANLQKLQAQEKKQEEIRQAAARAMQDRNRAEGRGGYQSSFGGDSGFMEGPSDPGADLTSTMGSFMDGGIVDLVDIYD